MDYDSIRPHFADFWMLGCFNSQAVLHVSGCPCAFTNKDRVTAGISNVEVFYSVQVTGRRGNVIAGTFCTIFENAIIHSGFFPM
jgi:hypothetical protein